jgi:protein transport protein SEC31
LDFNPLQSNLLSTGSNDGEVRPRRIASQRSQYLTRTYAFVLKIFIWDLTNPNKPYSPATRSTKLEDVTCVAWNRQVPHILASASTNGYTVIWDLRNRRELIQLAHPGGRKGITSISWNPDMVCLLAFGRQSTFILTCLSGIRTRKT